MHRDPWIPAEDRTKVFRLFGFSLSPLASGPLACSRSVGPKGAKGDSPGQSEAPPWVRLRDGSIGSFTLDEPFGPNLGGFRGR